MSDDHLTLSAVCDDAAVGPKWLAAATGRSLAQIYRYLSGEATIPSIVWRVLYAKTGDGRITQLITGDVPVVLVRTVPTAATVYEQIDRPGLKSMIRMRRQMLEVEADLLDILADGKVNHYDAKAIAAYKRHHPKAIEAACRLYLAIVDEYERSRT